MIVATLGDLRRRPVRRGQHPVAAAGRRSVGLHPVWLMFALFAFGSLFGFVGLLLAVPLAAAVGVLVRFALQPLPGEPALSGRDRPHRRRSVDDRCAESRRGSSPSTCPSSRASGARISSSARRTSRPTRSSSAGRTGPTPSLLLIGPRRQRQEPLAAIWAAARPRLDRRRLRVGARQGPAPGLGRRARHRGRRPGGARRGGPVPPPQSGPRDGARFVLLTARTPPDHWALRTPDLLSRLRLAPAVALGQPDDALLRAVLVKLFVDRQLVVDTSVVDYHRAADRTLARHGARRSSRRSTGRP